MVYRGRVVNGQIVLDGDPSIPEGTDVMVDVVSMPTADEPIGKALLRLAGTATGLPPDMSVNHDHYLHGQPKRATR
ncbi:MAG TPA: hypothetical protein VGN72_00455 [Tepidisphaeraceae bacterium]|jgi:hypothetical protein|nr:hypothetical protein [Tepidisphaeraceae bacterium]